MPFNSQAGSDWLYVYPRGIYDLLLHIKEKYNDPIIYITENGEWMYTFRVWYEIKKGCSMTITYTISIVECRQEDGDLVFKICGNIFVGNNASVFCPWQDKMSIRLLYMTLPEY
uniref:Uncharacterized protein n=1 Tax=Opuntia streptacantha TaxID=393608 RepID=A0A7C8YCY1_OPUST